ncbi:MAG TPA: metallophosphoesterase [Thermodesulfovibrionales bacterium]|nr:metallophosphoesterase [Thermodesulfovibrionales bacterium]
MLGKKRVYISDVHMGAGREPSGNHFSYDWLDLDEARIFADFLHHLIDDPEVGEIVLLGDTMDNWVCPIYEEPPTFHEIINSPLNAEIVKNLKSLAENTEKRLIYMPGNHDMLITKNILEKYFPGIVFGGSAAYKSVYRTSRLRAEHGSSYAMFNAPDAINNPGNRLPLGYFISRVAATKHAQTGSAERHFWTYADDLLELLGPEKLPSSVFEAVTEEAEIGADQEIRLSGSASIKVGEVKARYSDLYEQWKTHYGKGFAFKAVMAEIGYLDDFADMLCKKGDTNIVIFGHSHESDLDKDTWFVEDRVYANCGSWCDAKEDCTFVETQKDDEERIHHVRLNRWKNGAVEIIDETSVNL